MYFSNDEAELLRRIDSARKYTSRSSWLKQAADEKLTKAIPQSTNEAPQQEFNIDGFLDGF